MNALTVCPGCLRDQHTSYCPACRRNLFGGVPVSHVLPFTRPEYNARKAQSAGERMSISGVQTKHSLRLASGSLVLTERGGEYILKPVPHGSFERLDLLPANEHVTMQIASQVFGISTAINGLVFFPDGTPAYLTRRFDVLADGKKRGQEDFAQFAGRTAESAGKNYKYDFSYEEIGELLKRYVGAYQVEVEKLFTQILFSYVVQNGDAHLKNFSLFRSEKFGDHLMAPAYDLLNTRIHVPVEPDTALNLFKGDFTTDSSAVNGKYCQDDFTELGRRFGMQEERVKRIMGRFAMPALPGVQRLLDRSFLPPDVRETYLAHVRQRIGRLEYSDKSEFPPSSG